MDGSLLARVSLRTARALSIFECTTLLGLCEISCAERTMDFAMTDGGNERIRNPAAIVINALAAEETGGL